MLEYESDEIGELQSDDEQVQGTAEISKYSNIMDSFLENTSIAGQRIEKPSLFGKVSDLDDVRKTLSEVHPVDISKHSYVEEFEECTQTLFVDDDSDKENWDCESILCIHKTFSISIHFVATYSNLENHPAIISHASLRRTMMRRAKKAAKAQVEPIKEEEEENDVQIQEPEVNAPVAGAPRPKIETPEERRARKTLQKELKRERRADKKTTKLAFK